MNNVLFARVDDNDHIEKFVFLVHDKKYLLLRHGGPHSRQLLPKN